MEKKSNSLKEVNVKKYTLITRKKFSTKITRESLILEILSGGIGPSLRLNNRISDFADFINTKCFIVSRQYFSFSSNLSQKEENTLDCYLVKEVSFYDKKD